MLLVLDNLAGHVSPAFVIWLFDHGIIPLYTPLGGSWLNMAESIQRIIERRALEGQHPESPAEIIEWLEPSANTLRLGRQKSRPSLPQPPAALCPRWFWRLYIPPYPAAQDHT